MQIFGDIGEMREIAEGADDGARLLGGQGAQQRVEIAVRFGVVVAACGDGQAADRLDSLEYGRAFMFAHGVAEQTSEQANVLDEGFVAFRRLLLGDRRRSERNRLFLGLRLDLHDVL